MKRRPQLPHSRQSRISDFGRLLAIIAATSGVLGGAVSPVHADDKKPNTIIVQIDPSSGMSIDDINASYATTTVQVVTGIPSTFIVQPVNSKQDAHSTADHIRHDRHVLFADEEFLTGSIDGNPSRMGAWGEPTPSEYIHQNSAGLLNIQQAQTISRGAGVTVAVLDTGVEVNHHELDGRLVPGYDFVDNDPNPDDKPGGVESGHGTHVAGIIHLVAPDAKIMPIRVLDSAGQGSLIPLVEGIYFAIHHGANIINISLGTANDSAFLESLLTEARHSGIVVVSSAGNEGREVHQYPAAATCVVSVTSLDAADGHSSFSNYGDWISFAAPGESIYSTFDGNGFAYWSGTSMAAPFVSGQIALIRSVAPQYSFQDLLKVMQDTSVLINKLPSNHGLDNKLGYGQIDIGASVRAAATGYTSKEKPKHIKDECFR